MLMRSIPRFFGRVVPQANRIHLRVLMALQHRLSRLSHGLFLDFSSHVTPFASSAAGIKIITEARKVLWLGEIL